MPPAQEFALKRGTEALEGTSSVPLRRGVRFQPGKGSSPLSAQVNQCMLLPWVQCNVALGQTTPSPEEPTGFQFPGLLT